MEEFVAQVAAKNAFIIGIEGHGNTGLPVCLERDVAGFQILYQLFGREADLDQNAAVAHRAQ
jgi:hypothetical protein